MYYFFVLSWSQNTFFSGEQHVFSSMRKLSLSHTHTHTHTHIHRGSFLLKCTGADGGGARRGKWEERREGMSEQRHCVWLSHDQRERVGREGVSLLGNRKPCQKEVWLSRGRRSGCAFMLLCWRRGSIGSRLEDLSADFKSSGMIGGLIWGSLHRFEDRVPRWQTRSLNWSVSCLIN